MKRIKLPIATAILALLIIGIFIFTIITYNKGITERKNNIENIGLKLIIKGENFPVKLSNNNTTLELLNNLPYIGRMAKYEESFYIINIDKELAIDGEKTMELEAGNLYYNPAWKSLVLVYKDYSYDKNKMVLVGTIDKDIPNKDSIVEVAVKQKGD